MDCRHIQDVVAAYYGCSVLDMTSHRRSQLVARPRMVAMYLCRHLTKASYPEIGRAFDKDHTTIMSGIKRVESLMQTLGADITILHQRLITEKIVAEPPDIAKKLAELSARVYKLETREESA